MYKASTFKRQKTLHAVGAAAMSLFEADNISINFGGIKAVDGVTFNVAQGEVFTIIGPNGAGKTTIFNLISRIYEPTGGRLASTASDITNVPPHTIAALGIARTFQNIELFEHATVLHNLLLGRHAHKPDLLLGTAVPAAGGAGDGASRGGRAGDRLSRPAATSRHAIVRPALRRAQGDGAGPRACAPSPSCCCSTSPRPASMSRRPRTWRSGSRTSRTSSASPC